MLLPFLIFLAVFGISGWYFYHWEIFFNSDFAMIGLLAKRILENGETFLFVPKVGYQGLLVEGYLSALVFKFLGVSPRTLHLTPIIVFIVFIWTYYLAVKVWFGKRTALLSSFLICFSSPFFFGNVLRTQPNYGETFALGSLLFWAFKKRVDTAQRKYFFLGSFLTGFGFYLYGQILFFVLAVFVSWIQHLCRVDLWNSIRRSSWQKYLLLGGVAAALVPSVTLGKVLIPGPSVGVFCVLICFVTYLIQNRRTLLAGINQDKQGWLLGFGCFLLGYAPSLYHRFVLGLFAKSGIKLIKFSEEFWSNFRLLIFNVSDFVVGSEFSLLSILATLAAGFILVFWCFEGIKEKKAYLNPFFILGPIIVVGFLSSRSVNEPFSLRYILGLHLVLSLAFSDFARRFWSGHKAIVGSLVVVWVCLGIFSNYRAPSVWKKSDKYPQLTQWANVKEVVDFMTERNVKVGYSDYWAAYLINFVTNGRLILDPLISNYLPFVEEAPKAAETIILVKPKDLSEAAKKDESSEMVIGSANYRIIERKHLEQWTVWVLGLRAFK